MDNCKQNQPISPRTALVPDAISSVLHWTETVNDRLTELYSRLSPVLRNEPMPTDDEPMPTDEPDTRRPSCNVLMANDINEAASRANAAAERIEDILRRLEL